MADVLAAELKGYLCAAGRRPFYWGEIDCFLFVADWVEKIRGVDPAGEFRGAYASAREARSLVKANGGTLRFAHALLHRAGCEMTDGPDAGDVALVRAPAIYRGKIISVPVGAICLRQNLWAIKCADASLAYAPLPVIRAWKV